MATFRSIGLIPAPLSAYGRHQHEHWEVVLYLEGEGAITVGDEPVPFAPGTIVCLPPRIPHHEQSRAGYRNYHLAFSDYTPPVPGVPRCRDDAAGTFASLCGVLLRESRLGQPRARAVCQHLAQSLGELVERWCSPVAGASLVERLKAELYARHGDPRFGVAAALARLDCAPDHARRVFRAATARTPLQWLTDLRLAEAKLQLSSGAGVAETAAKVGFADPGYFARIFTRAVGSSPSRWAAAVAGAGRGTRRRAGA